MIPGGIYADVFAELFDGTFLICPFKEMYNQISFQNLFHVKRLIFCDENVCLSGFT